MSLTTFDVAVAQRARPTIVHLLDDLNAHPLLSVALTVLSFSFFGPLAALVLVATMLDHEFAHHGVMKHLGYEPGPVRLVPFLGAAVRSGKPMIKSADIALIYLAGPLAGILSATAAFLLARYALDPDLAQRVGSGALIAIGLNLFNLIPIEPLDGGLVARALPYQVLVLFPVAMSVWLWNSGLPINPPIAIVVVGCATVVTLQKLKHWRRYTRNLRSKMQQGNKQAETEWHAAFDVPLRIRLLVVINYLIVVPTIYLLLHTVAMTNGW